MDTPVPWRIDWTDALSVGIPEVDDEHRHFLDLTNAFNTAVRERAEITRIRALMEDILRGMHTHFAHEEQWLAEHGYPEREQHALMHRNIVETLEQRLAALGESSHEPEWIQVGLDARDLLVRHMLEEDLKFHGIGTPE